LASESKLLQMLTNFSTKFALELDFEGTSQKHIQFGSLHRKRARRFSLNLGTILNILTKFPVEKIKEIDTIVAEEEVKTIWEAVKMYPSELKLFLKTLDGIDENVSEEKKKKISRMMLKSFLKKPNYLDLGESIKIILQQKSSAVSKIGIKVKGKEYFH